MKRLLRIALTFAMASCLLPLAAGQVLTVSAEQDFGYYPMQCSSGQYEVDTVNDDGTFAKKACTADLGSAKSAMEAAGADAVVRHSASASQTHIIMMTNGVVYSYPQRDNANIVTLQQSLSDTTSSNKSTYVTFHREMSYSGTWAYDAGSGNGQIGVSLNGFDGYISLRDVDLIPMKYVTRHIAVWLGGNQSANYKEDPFLTYVYQGYYQVEQKGSYLDLVYHCWSGWADPAGSTHEPAGMTFDIGPAASWMSVNSVYFSRDGFTFYNDRYYGSVAGTYYDYYQFLPLRSKSSVSAATFNTFLTARGKDSTSKLWDQGQVFLNAQQQYGVNALLVYAMACLESNYGMSPFAQQRNNLFGWSAYDSDPDQASYFSSITDAINQHMALNLRGYLNTLDTRFFGPQLGNKGSGLNVKYAGDPYWGMKIAAIAYDIDKCSNSYNGSLTDFNASSIGVIANDAFTDILSSVNGSVLYNTAYGAKYQKNHMVSILAESGDWYEIQSTDYLKDGAVMKTNNVGMTVYDWNAMIGWVQKSKVVRANSTALAVKGDTPTGDAVETLDSISFAADGTLALSGRSYRPGIYVTADNTAVQTLKVLDLSYAQVREAALTSTLTGNDVLSWSTNLDLSALAKGTYLFQVDTAYQAYSAYSQSYQLAKSDGLNLDFIRKGISYHLDADASSGLVRLTVADVSCGTGASYDAAADACVCSSGYENWQSGSGCTAKQTSDTVQIMRSVDAASYGADGHTVTISGAAFLKGMNASADSADITETVYLLNLETGEETPVQTATANASPAYNLYDGYDYTKILYQASLDLETVAPGNYSVKIRVTNGSTTQDAVLAYGMGSEALDSRYYTRKDGCRAVFKASSLSNYRLEVRIEKSQIDQSVISKPNRSASIFGQDTLKLTGSVLSMEAFAFPLGTAVSAEVHPSVQLLLVSDADGSVTALTPQPENHACTFDITSLRGSSYDLSDACFKAETDLAGLKDGTYRMYLDIRTDKARDIFELYSISDVSLPSSVSGKRSYSIEKSPVRSRYVLTVSTASTVAQPSGSAQG